MAWLARVASPAGESAPRRRFAWLLAVAAVTLVAPPLHRSGSGPPVEVVWTFEAERRGAFLAGPLVAGGRVYATAAHDSVFANAGAVYCLDEATGKLRWRFDDGGKMQHSYSRPTKAGGWLYAGEGMHANFTCHLYCLDADTGQFRWRSRAEGHIESSAWVDAGRVVFSAGDDGILCVDADTGARRWQCAGPFHTDSDPVVAGERVFAGCGVSRTKRVTQALCLRASDGSVLWRYPTDLPVWGSPVVDGDDVFFGLGNGRLLVPPQSPDQPRGGVLCLRAASGALRWRFDAGDAVFSRVTVADRAVFLGSRDGRCTCLDRATGRVRWQRDLGSPVVTRPAYAGRRLYVVASGGTVCSLDAATGRPIWTFDVAAHTRTSPQLLSSPQVIERDGTDRRIYFGTELRNASRSAAVLYCLRD